MGALHIWPPEDTPRFGKRMFYGVADSKVLALLNTLGVLYCSPRLGGGP